jgi:hypothetical protein
MGEAGLGRDENGAVYGLRGHRPTIPG